LIGCSPIASYCIVLVRRIGLFLLDRVSLFKDLALRIDDWIGLAKSPK
jgi:hypothetical protein